MGQSAGPQSVGGYLLLRPIGGGGAGQVWLAREKVRGNLLKAVKILDNDKAHADAARRELEGISQYVSVGRGHPGIIQIDDAGETDDKRHLYYAMELADDAITLKDPSGASPELDIDRYVPLTLELVMKRQPLMPPRQALDIVRSILQALKHLHQHGLFHRDVKPSNIVFVKGQPKLCDFGLLTRMNREVTQVGTPGYLPPDAVLDQTADLYALGMVLYEMLSGLPRSHTQKKLDRRKWLRGLDRVAFDAAVQVMLRATQLDRRRRFDTADEMLEAIRSRIEPQARMRRRIKWAAGSALALAVISLGITVIPWKSIVNRLDGYAPTIPVRLNVGGADGRALTFYYDNGDSRLMQFGEGMVGVVLSDFFDGRPSIAFGSNMGSPDYGKLVVLHHAAPTSNSELVRTYEERPTSMPPDAWNFQDHPKIFEVRPLTTGDLDPSPGNELLVALNHDDAPAELVMLGRGGKRLGSYWHFGWFTAAWLCDLDHDGVNEIICQLIANRRMSPMAVGRQSEPQHNGMMILTADMLRESNGFWGMNEWLSAGSPMSPLAYGYCPIRRCGPESESEFQYWQLSLEQLPCLAGPLASQLRAYFKDGQYIDLDNRLRPIRIDVMPGGTFDRRRLPPVEDAWVNSWPPDSMKDAPAPRE